MESPRPADDRGRLDGSVSRTQYAANVSTTRDPANKWRRTSRGLRGGPGASWSSDDRLCIQVSQWRLGADRQYAVSIPCLKLSFKSTSYEWFVVSGARAKLSRSRQSEWSVTARTAPSRTRSAYAPSAPSRASYRPVTAEPSCPCSRPTESTWSSKIRPLPIPASCVTPN
jgi:hypothetical protein